MESHRGWLILLVLLALSFLFLMGSVRGLRIERVKPEEARWSELYFIWDWNKLADFWEEKNFLRREPREEERRQPL